MSENDNQGASALDTGTPAEGTQQEVTWENSPIARIYNPDGTPKADAAKVFDEMGKGEIAGHALRNGQDLFTALKTGRDATAFASQKMEGVVKLPGEDATDDQRAEFHKALGALPSKDDALASIWPDDLPEGYQKDEGLAEMIADHVATNPVNTADSLKQLVVKFDELQSQRLEEIQKTSLEEAQKVADATKDTLTAELGGTTAFETFAKDAGDFAVDGKLKEFGFEFYRGEDGKLQSDNPTHQAMLSDVASLRWIKSTMEAYKPARLPGSNPDQAGTVDADTRARELYNKFAGPGGWTSDKAYSEYKKLRGIG